MDVVECEYYQLLNVILPFYKPRTTKKHLEEPDLKSVENVIDEKLDLEVKYILQGLAYAKQI